ncbi:flagellar export protein FliJ [Agaribacterium sp. ZY112]|uniref:flagellar export protein FliJ n=1 Tax=Agaribacterium sp. ZY112 TaxID=3233574 RepID=UPI003524E105
MADSKSKRIKLLLKLAQQKCDEAAQQFTQQLEILEQQTQQLATLKQYYADYEKQFSQFHMRPDELEKARTFLAHLQDACSSQERVLEQAQAQCQRAKEHWQKEHHRNQAIDDYRLRHQQEQHSLRQKQDQKLIDEQVMLRYRRN